MRIEEEVVEEISDIPRSKRSRYLRALKLSSFSVLMVLLAASLFVVSSAPLFWFNAFENDVANHMLNYQLSALPIAGLALLLTWLFAGQLRLSYLSSRRTGELRPYFAQRAGGRWEADGWNLGFMMCGIVGVVTFFQFLPGGFTFHWATALLVVPLAASNAFIEESIYRLPYVTMGANDTNSRIYGLFMGSAVFGAMHYWGVAPNGFLGALMAAFLGFILAKSMQETRGFYWAFMIHFLLDIVVVVFILNQAP